MAIRNNYTLALEYDEKDEAEIEPLLENATGIAEDALAAYFDKHNVDNITFSIDHDHNETVEPGSLLRELQLDA